MDTVKIIETLRGKRLYNYLNGECYVFAKMLRDKIGGTLRYLILEQHFILEKDNKLYDASGNVTKQYRNSRYITEEEFNNRSKLKQGIIA